MLSVNSERKSQNEKKPNKRYQKFRRKQGDDNTNTVSSNESDCKSVDSKKVSKVTFSGKLHQENLYNTDKPCSSGVIIETKKKLGEATPNLHSSKNMQKNENNFKKMKEELPKSNSGNDFSVLEKSSPEVGIEKENCLKMNKTSKGGSSKPTSAVPYRNPYKKKRTDPLLISFEDILSNKRTKRKTRDHNFHKAKVQKHRNQEQLSGNFLDSSNPKRSRGKHREIKKKKLSNLKLLIIKERIIKHKIGETPTEIEKIDFVKEIKAYLNELQSIKLRNSQNSKNNLTKNLNDGNIPKEREEVVENVVKKEVSDSNVEEKEENSKSIVCKVTEEKIPEVRVKEEIKFSSKFREYCDNLITPELNSAVADLIKGLINLQDRLFLRDPIKAKVKRRHVSGIREVKKYLNLKKVKMIIIAPNLEKLQMEGSIYDSINELKSMANSQNVPYGFALDRYKMGRCTKKNVPVSAFAVLSYDGIEGLYESVLHQLMEAKRKFSETVKANTVKEENVDNSKLMSSIISAFREELKVSREEELQQQDGL